MTVTSPKFVVNIPNEHITEKIERSAKQCANMEFYVPTAVHRLLL